MALQWTGRLFVYMTLEQEAVETNQQEINYLS